MVVEWPPIADEALVERLIPAIQRTIADVASDHLGIAGEDVIPIGIADLSNVLLMLLATVLEPMPASSTPQGTRRLADAACKELAMLIRDTKRLKAADAQEPGTSQ